MIIVVIKGGLGNQLFEYAAGRALSLRQQKADNSEPLLKLDTSNYSLTNNIYPLRHYGLCHFNIIENIATLDEISTLKYPRGILSLCYKTIRTKLGFFNVVFIPRMLHKKGNIYLEGYWQTEKYFEDFKEQIQRELTLVKPISSRAKYFKDQIKRKSPSISLHIRRGDYADSRNTNRHFGTCSESYYSEALKFIASKIAGTVNVFVFSDDIEWVKRNIFSSYSLIHVSSPEIPDHEELILMSLCDHNVISNSTFGWWGAWLNKNTQKLIVAPKRWTKKKNFIFRDIIPPSWTRL